jgi:hypothetical protein
LFLLFTLAVAWLHPKRGEMLRFRRLASLSPGPSGCRRCRFLRRIRRACSSGQRR